MYAQQHRKQMDSRDETPILVLSQPEVYYILPITSLTVMTRVCHGLAVRCRALRNNTGFWLTYTKLHPREDTRSYNLATTGAEMEFLYFFPSYSMRTDIPQVGWFPVPCWDRVVPLLYGTHNSIEAESLYRMFIAILITHGVCDEVIIPFLDVANMPYCGKHDMMCESVVLYASDAAYLRARSYAKYRLHGHLVRDTLKDKGNAARYIHLATIDTELPNTSNMKQIVYLASSVEEGKQLTSMALLFPLAQKIANDGDNYRHTLASTVVTQLLCEPPADVVELLVEWEVMSTMASGALLLVRLLTSYSRMADSPARQALRQILVMILPLLVPIPTTNRTTRNNMVQHCKASSDDELLELLQQQLAKK